MKRVRLQKLRQGLGLVFTMLGTIGLLIAQEQADEPLPEPPTDWRQAEAVLQKWGSAFVRGDIKGVAALTDRYDLAQGEDALWLRMRSLHQGVRSEGYGAPVGVAGVEFRGANVYVVILFQDSDQKPAVRALPLQLVPEGGRWLIDEVTAFSQLTWLKQGLRYPKGFKGTAREYAERLLAMGSFAGEWKLTQWGDERFVPDLDKAGLAVGSSERAAGEFVHHWIKGDVEGMLSIMSKNYRRRFPSARVLKAVLQRVNSEATPIMLQSIPVTIYFAAVWFKTSEPGRPINLGEEKKISIHKPYRWVTFQTLRRVGGDFKVASIAAIRRAINDAFPPELQNRKKVRASGR